MKTVPIEKLHELLEYSPETGVLMWSTTSTRIARSKGLEAGSVAKDGYRVICVDGVCIPAHRIAWAMTHGSFPELPMDHINRVRGDNRIVNLRLATPSQNCANTVRKSAAGIRGITQLPHGAWQAQIKVGGVGRYLGSFPTKGAAAAAYAVAAKQSFGEFAYIPERAA